MKQFKGKRALNLVFNKENYAAYRRRVKLTNQYFLPFTLLALCLSVFMFQNRDKIDSSSVLAFITFMALSISGVLYFKLSKEKEARRAADKNSKINAIRLDHIYNAGIIGILYTRFDGVITDANDEFLDMIGYSRADLEAGGISWVDMTPPEYNDISQSALSQLKAKGVCEPFTKEYCRKDGTRVSVLLGSSLLNDDDKAQILTYAIDITNLKDAERREIELGAKMRHQQEEMFRILNEAPVAIVIRKGPKLETEYVNQTALNYTPFNHGEVVGITAEDFHKKLKTNYDTTELFNIYRTGKTIRGNAQKVTYDRDGSGELAEGWFDYVWQPVYDEEGKISGVATFTFEVTELVQANQLLKENEGLFRFIADAIPHKMWTSRPDGEATYYNRDWMEYLNEDDIQKLRIKAWESIHPEELETVKIAWENAITKGEDLEIEQRLRRHDGVYHWHLTRVCACKDDKGRITMYVGSSTNIHEQKTANIALRLASDKKDEFLGIASHELRTPITSMKAALQSLEKGFVPGFDAGKLQSLVAIANRQVNKLTFIVNDLVDVNKIQAGKLQLNKYEYLLSDSIKELVSGVEIQHPDCRFVVDLRSESLIYADKIRIEQVLTNLFTNAVKYSPPDGTIRIVIQEQPAGMKCIITDDGIGIPYDIQPYIFDRFFRVHGSSQNFPGLGLGLYISAEIIKQHQGSIGVESTEGQGSQFWFILPYKG
jgi:PAS domain S-box-containing protein